MITATTQETANVATAAPNIVDDCWRIPQKTLANGLAGVLHAADRDNDRPFGMRFALSSVRIEFSPGRITFVATDGRRLAWDETACEHGGETGAINLPLPIARQLSRIHASGKTATISVWNAGGKALATWTDGRRKERLQAFEPSGGRYPKWRNTVADHELCARNSKGSLACKDASILAEHFAPETFIDICLNGSATVGQQPAPLDSRIETRGEVEARFDRELIHDYLSALGETPVALFFAAPDKPIYGAAPNGPSALIMPLSKPEPPRRRRRK